MADDSLISGLPPIEWWMWDEGLQGFSHAWVRGNSRLAEAFLSIPGAKGVPGFSPEGLQEAHRCFLEAVVQLRSRLEKLRLALQYAAYISQVIIRNLGGRPRFPETGPCVRNVAGTMLTAYILFPLLPAEGFRDEAEEVDVKEYYETIEELAGVIASSKDLRDSLDRVANITIWFNMLKFITGGEEFEDWTYTTISICPVCLITHSTAITLQQRPTQTQIRALLSVRSRRCVECGTPTVPFGYTLVKRRSLKIDSQEKIVDYHNLIKKFPYLNLYRKLKGYIKLVISTPATYKALAAPVAKYGKYKYLEPYIDNWAETEDEAPITPPKPYHT